MKSGDEWIKDAKIASLQFVLLFGQRSYRYWKCKLLFTTLLVTAQLVKFDTSVMRSQCWSYIAYFNYSNKWEQVISLFLNQSGPWLLILVIWLGCSTPGWAETDRCTAVAKFPRGAKFRHNCVTSQINFRGSAEGTTIVRGSGGMSPGKVCKITPKNTHFCAFWKQVLVWCFYETY